MKKLSKYMPKYSVQLLVVLAMLMGLKLVVGKVATVTILPTLKVGFSFIPNAMIGAVAGPIISPVMFFLSDAMNVALNPSGPYLWPYALLEVIQGFIYGLFFYRKRLNVDSIKDWGYVTVAVLAVMLVGTFIGIPILNKIYYGVPIEVQYFAQGRILKIFEIPVRVIGIMFVLPALQKIPQVKKYLL